jgi:predicted RNase H-like HicB family nuclease
VAEKTDTGYSAYSPDLPGCVATGRTRAEVRKAMREAIQFHLDGLRADRVAPPAPHSYSLYCEIPA